MQSLPSNLEIQIYDWPDSFLVEASTPDRDYQSFYPNDPPEVYPHFVELSVYDTGFCSCRDFRFNIEPNLNTTDRRECIHIIAARRYRSQFTEKPKPMPSKLFL